MKKFLYFPVIAAAAIILLNCSKKSSSDDNNNPSYTDNLKLGTGIDSVSMQLTGEGTAFSSNPGDVFFRLESKDDFSGSNVIIQVKVDSSGVFVPYSVFNFTSVPPTGHVFLSSFKVKKAGSYQATGIFETGNKTIASVNFTMF